MSKKVRVMTRPKHRVILNLTMQEAALVSLLLGATPVPGPGKELYDALSDLFPVDQYDKSQKDGLRTLASRGIPFANTLNPHVLNYLGQYPGD